MSAARRALVAVAATAVLTGCAQASVPTAAELAGPDGVSAEEVESAETEPVEPIEESHAPLPQPTEVPEGGNGEVPRRTAAAVPAEALVGSDVLGYSWSFGADSTAVTGYDVSLCGAEPGAATAAQRSRSYSEVETDAVVRQQVRVYDEAAATAAVAALRSAVAGCTTATVAGAGAAVSTDPDPRLGDDSVQVRLRSSDGDEQTWLVVRLHEAVSSTLIDAGSGDRDSTVATVGDLVISALCAATEHGCES